MTVALCDIELQKLDVRDNFKPIIIALMLNYALVSGIILVMNILLIEDMALFRGFIIMVATHRCGDDSAQLTFKGGYTPGTGSEHPYLHAVHLPDACHSPHIAWN
jgi:hypothetical protein